MNLPDEFLERIKQSNDIVTAMSNYATLRKAGRDFVCLCPFHSEKTPSCHVYVDNQSFYCFGCGTGGSVFTFVQLTQNLDYMSAVRMLAERSGIPMPDEDDEQGKEELRKRALTYEMNKVAAKFFCETLLSEEGKAGLQFYRGRGINDNSIRKYGLGYAPDSWNALKYHMNAKGYSDSQLVEASLLRTSSKENGGNGVYDMFRARAMFPVIDRLGRVIAFSGRRIDSEKDYKYVNSRDTIVYKKGDNLFSINFAKNSKKKYIILCEGNIDAVMLNQAGFDNAVAILGTALTPSQARLLRFYCEEVAIAYDTDAAGEKATVKTINLLNQEGMSARVLQMQGANDPDEYIKLYGADSFAALVEKSGSAISFELGKLKKELDLEFPENRAEYLKKAVSLLCQVENKIDRMVYVSEVANDCQVTVAGVQDAIDAAVKSKRYRDRKDERRDLLRSQTVQDKINPDAEKFPVEEKAERGIIAFLFHSPDKLPAILRNLNPSDFPTAFNRKLFENLIIRLSKGHSIDISSIGSEFSALEVGRIEKIKIENAVVEYTDERLSDYINVLLNYKKSKAKKDFSEMSLEEAKAYTEELKLKKLKA